MQLNTVYIYSDASYSKTYNLAIIGYAIFPSSHEHETVPLSETNICILQVPENNNIRAEIRGVITALQSCPKGSKVVLYTDCKTVCDLPKRREKLEANNFISKSKGLTLLNADIYQEFYLNFDRLNPELKWVKGHSPKNSKLTQVQKNFSYLDKAVRMSLRKAIENKA